MDILNGILTRRSIRKYSSGIITREHVEELIKYGMYAPSARNAQPWHFVLMNDQDVFMKIIDIHPHAKMLLQAQWGIAVCGDEQLAHTPDYWPVDCSAVSQNILLAAHGMGYGAVWIGIYPRPERMSALKELLQLPPHIHVLSIISVGHPAQEIPQPERFHPERIHLNKFGN